MRANKFPVFFSLIFFLSVTPVYCADPIIIIRALVKNADIAIKVGGQHCEICKQESVGEIKEITLGDVLSHYIDFSLKENNKNIIETLKCTGETIQDCTFEYGNKSRWNNPGWQIFLKFKFNSGTQQIVTGSIEYIQVP